MSASSTALGDCFVVAAQLITCDGEFADNPDARLVHGIPLGTAGAAEGTRFWHAWIEVTQTVNLPLTDTNGEVTGWVPHTMVTCYDRSNGNDVELPAQLYYKVGQIEQTWRYTTHEATLEMLAAGNYGPWVDVDAA